ncbi:MAG: hypothetical protein WC568_10455 [Candidatus Methanoperedens sp.]
MFEKLKDASRYGEELVKAEKNAVDDVDELKEKVPKKIGVYLWRSKKDGQIVYIGRALGKEGLNQRIIHQHLNESYYNCKKGQEKSIFRKRVAAKNGNLEPDKVVPFIKENYTLSFKESPNEDKLLAAFVEKLLQFELKPKYSPLIPDTK